MTDNIDIVWELLFSEELEKVPDPNNPANQARFNVLRNERSEGLKRLRQGAGKPLFEMWEKKLKSFILSLLQDPRYRQCNCPATQLILQISTIIELWTEAEQAIREKT